MSAVRAEIHATDGESITLPGWWVALLKLSVAAFVPLLLLLLSWGTWATMSIVDMRASELRSENARLKLESDLRRDFETKRSTDTQAIMLKLDTMATGLSGLQSDVRNLKDRIDRSNP